MRQRARKIHKIDFNQELQEAFRLIHANQPQEAFKITSKLSSLIIGNQLNAKDKQIVYSIHAKAAEDCGYLELALKIYKMSKDEFPLNWTNYLCTAAIYRKLHRYSDMLKELDSVISGAQGDKNNKIYLAQAYTTYSIYFSDQIQPINLIKSMEYAKKAIATDPEYAIGWSQLGKCLKAEHRYKEAYDCFNKARTIDPSRFERKHPESVPSLNPLPIETDVFSENLIRPVRGFQLSACRSAGPGSSAYISLKVSHAKKGNAESLSENSHPGVVASSFSFDTSNTFAILKRKTAQGEHAHPLSDIKFENDKPQARAATQRLPKRRVVIKLIEVAPREKNICERLQDHVTAAYSGCRQKASELSQSLSVKTCRLVNSFWKVFPEKTRTLPLHLKKELENERQMRWRN